MAIRNVGPTAPATTRAARFFTMVDMNQNTNNTAANVSYITDLIAPDPGGNSSTYLPGNAGSSYAAGAIAALVFAEDQSQYGYATNTTLVNDAVINQASLLNSMGSIAMSYNLSQNMQALRTTIESTLPDTADGDRARQTTEVQNAICNACISSPDLDHFLQTMSTTYQEIYSSTLNLAVIYENLQILPTAVLAGMNPVNDLLDYEGIANATIPPTAVNTNTIEALDPINETNLVQRVITPAAVLGARQTSPTISVYEETSSTINNAVLVNNLVVTGMAIQMQTTGPTPALSRNAGDRINIDTVNMGMGGSGVGY